MQTTEESVAFPAPRPTKEGPGLVVFPGSNPQENCLSTLPTVVSLNIPRPFPEALRKQKSLFLAVVHPDGSCARCPGRVEENPNHLETGCKCEDDTLGARMVMLSKVTSP